MSFAQALQFLREMFFCLMLSLLIGKGVGYTDALLTISHHIQKSLHTGMESYSVQHDFSAALKECVTVVSYSNLSLLV